MKKQWGCLSVSGLVTATAVTLVIAVFLITGGGTIFNPGPLNAQAGDALLGGVSSHADLSRQCSACHPPPWATERMTDRCLVCHSSVAAELLNPASLHAALAATGGSTCQTCHPEHNGPAAPLTVVNPQSFPHTPAVGFSLQAHQTRSDGAPFACVDCHPNDLRSFDRLICDACHRQQDETFMQSHLVAFGPDCLACHDGLDTYGAAFDHNQTVFPLDGKHAQVECSGCHLGMLTIADLQTTLPNCYSCHRQDDAHQGRFGLECQTCHTPATWERPAFDHGETAFPLTGAHTEVTCEQCHFKFHFQATPADCAACHEEPVSHPGLFGPACAGCHTTAAWTPAQFNGPHPFPINHGARQPNACQTCHPDSLQVYTCYTCHEHTPAKIRAEHLEEGIRDFADCVACHPTGREEEGEREGEDD